MIPPTARSPRFRLTVVALLGLMLAGTLAPRLAAQATSVTGVYESEGTVADAVSGYTGPVSLSALFAVQLDFALGVHEHAEIARVEILQEEKSLTVRTITTAGKVFWSGEWKRDGGYESTKDGAKLMLRPKRPATDLYMFTLNPLAGGQLLVKIQRVIQGRMGALGQDVGNFVFIPAERKS